MRGTATYRAIFSRKFLLLQERLEIDKALLPKLRERATALVSQIEELEASIASNQKTKDGIEAMLLHWDEEWTPEIARRELPFVKVKHNRDGSLKDDLITVLKAARSPISAREIAIRIRKLRGEAQSEPDHPLLKYQMSASVSTILRRGDKTLFVDHGGRPKKWTLRR